MVTIACIIIASTKREELVEHQILPSLWDQGFDEVNLITDGFRPPVTISMYGPPSAAVSLHGRPPTALYVEPVTRTTLDALIKRDVGALATTSDLLVYLSDDHMLDRNFARDLREHAMEDWDVLVPDRWVHQLTEENRLWDQRLNMGLEGAYCGGHAGVFRRKAIRDLPWMAGPHDRLWDLTNSKWRQQMGQKFQWAEGYCKVWDVEPNATPWL